MHWEGIDMKRCIFTFFVLAATFSLAGPAAQAQELLYGQRDNQVSYDGAASRPGIAFNGKDLAAFYFWSGLEDAGAGLYMRRIGTDGKPFGPQRQILAMNLSGKNVEAVWDGSAYLVFIARVQEDFWHIVRVDPSGKMLGHRTVPVTKNRRVNYRPLPFVVGDRVFFFFLELDPLYLTFGFSDKTFLITVDRQLKEEPVLRELTGGFPHPTLLGVALDPDKFLVYLGQYSFDYSTRELKSSKLLHVDFKGKTIKSIQPAAFNTGGSNPAVNLKPGDASFVAGPIYTGDGYRLIMTRNYYNGAGSSLPYNVNSLKIDDTGEIIQGFQNLGNAGAYMRLSTSPVLLGGIVAVPTTEYFASDHQLMLIGKNGRHIKDVSIHEIRHPAQFNVTMNTLIYTGNGSVVATIGWVQRFSNNSGSAVFSNFLTDPPFVKPAIQYFQSSNGAPFGDTRKLVMWSASSCTNVTLTGPDFELTNLPPVFHTVVDTNGERTVLRLSITGTDGSTKTRRLIIEP